MTQLEGQLKVGQMEMTGLRNQLKMEADFSGKRGTEIERLGEEIKQLNSKKDWLRAEKDKLKAELKQLKDASQPATGAQATYPPPVGTGVPPGTPYGSPGLSQVHMLGHFSPNIPPYGMAAAQAAYAGPGGQAQGYGSPQQQPPPPGLQYQGSSQAQQVAMNLFRPSVELRQESSLAQSSDAPSQAVVSTPGDNIGPFHLKWWERSQRVPGGTPRPGPVGHWPPLCVPY